MSEKCHQERPFALQKKTPSKAWRISDIRLAIAKRTIEAFIPDRSGRPGLRACKARKGRERCGSGCETQKLTARKSHGVPPESTADTSGLSISDLSPFRDRALELAADHPVQRVAPASADGERERHQSQQQRNLDAAGRPEHAAMDHDAERDHGQHDRHGER